MDIQRVGSRASVEGPEDWFTGSVRIDFLFDIHDPARSGGASVTFEPGEKHWHGASPTTAMSHIAIQEQKRRLAEKITRDVTEVLGYDESTVSVAMEEVASTEWAERVYRPDIVDASSQLYKTPGHTM